MYNKSNYYQNCSVKFYLINLFSKAVVADLNCHIGCQKAISKRKISAHNTKKEMKL